MEKNKYKIFHFLLGILKTGLISTYLLKKYIVEFFWWFFWACCFMNPKNEISMCRILLRKTESTSKWNFPYHPFHLSTTLKPKKNWIFFLTSDSRAHIWSSKNKKKQDSAIALVLYGQHTYIETYYFFGPKKGFLIDLRGNLHMIYVLEPSYTN